MTRINSFLAGGALALAAIIVPAAQAQDKAPVIQTNSPWESSAAMGLTLTRGNSENLLFTANILTQRKGPKNEISLGADGTYGETTDQDTDETTRNSGMAHGFAQYNYLFTERFYGYARLDALHDAVAAIHYRFSLSPGAGYYFIKNPKTFLAGEVGPGFVTERIHNNDPDIQGDSHDDDDDYMTIRFAERFEHKFSPTVRLWQTLEYLPQIDLWGNYIINGEVGIEAALSKKLSLRTFFQDTYDNQPAEGRKQNDMKLVTALAYKF